MIIIGCDYHPGFQQIAFVDTETGDCGEQRLEHCEGAQEFYRDLATQGTSPDSCEPPWLQAECRIEAAV
jgi:hypothetical protein